MKSHKLLQRVLANFPSFLPYPYCKSIVGKGQVKKTTSCQLEDSQNKLSLRLSTKAISTNRFFNSKSVPESARFTTKFCYESLLVSLCFPSIQQ